MSASSNSMRVAEIFTQAGLAFNKLGEMAMSLANNTSNSGTASKWSDTEIAMLREAVSRFGRDLSKITEVLRNKSVAQIRNQLRRKEFKDAGFGDPGDLPCPMSPLKKEALDADKGESLDKSRRRRLPTSGRKQQLPPPQKRRKLSPTPMPEDDDEELDDEDMDEPPMRLPAVSSASVESGMMKRPPPIVGTMAHRPSSSVAPRPSLRKQMGSLVSRQPIIEDDDDEDDEDEEEEDEGLEDEGDTEPGYVPSNLTSPSENVGFHSRHGGVSDIEEEEDLGEEIDDEEGDDQQVKEEDDEDAEDYMVDEDDDIDDDEENLNM